MWLKIKKNLCGKKNAYYQQILLFPECYKMVCLCDSQNTAFWWENLTYSALLTGLPVDFFFPCFDKPLYSNINYTAILIGTKVVQWLRESTRTHENPRSRRARTRKKKSAKNWGKRERHLDRETKSWIENGAERHLDRWWWDPGKLPFTTLCIRIL